MEITGAFHPPSPYSGANRATGQAQHRPPVEQPRSPAPLQQHINAEANNASPRQKRFQSQQQDLSHPAQRAINSYMESDFADGPELLNRVDVYV